MQLKRAAVVDECLGLAKEGKEYLEIRKRLERKGLDKEEISAIMRLVSSDLERTALKKTRSGYRKEVRLAGLFVFLTGVFITIGTYLGLINTGNMYVIAYGPVVGGLALMLTGQFWENRS